MCRSSPPSVSNPSPVRTRRDVGIGHRNHKLSVADTSQVSDGRTLLPISLDRLPEINLPLFQNYYSKVQAIWTRRPSDASSDRSSKLSQGEWRRLYFGNRKKSVVSSTSTSRSGSSSRSNELTNSDASASTGRRSSSSSSSDASTSNGRRSSSSSTSCDRTAASCPSTHPSTSSESDGAKTRKVRNGRRSSSSSSGDASASDGRRSSSSSCDRTAASCPSTSPSTASESDKPRTRTVRGRRHRPRHQSASLNRRVEGIVRPSRYPADASPARRPSRVSVCSLGLTEFPAHDDGWVPLGADFEANVEVYVRKVDLSDKNMEVYVHDVM